MRPSHLPSRAPQLGKAQDREAALRPAVSSGWRTAGGVNRRTGLVTGLVGTQARMLTTHPGDGRGPALDPGGSHREGDGTEEMAQACLQSWAARERQHMCHTQGSRGHMLHESVFVKAGQPQTHRSHASKTEHARAAGTAEARGRHEGQQSMSTDCSLSLSWAAPRAHGVWGRTHVLAWHSLVHR